jgi:hypothetical protein
VESKVKCDDGVNVSARAVSLSDEHDSVSDVFHAKRLCYKVRLEQSTCIFLYNSVIHERQQCDTCAPRE